MTSPSPDAYVSRGGEKLATALDHFRADVADRVCADLGTHVGGFVDCLLRRGAAKVFSVDTAYGLIAWKLRKDPRVVTLERTNAMHVTLPEQAEFVTIDVGWTPQSKILPNVARMITPSGRVVSLIKPHYEAPKGMLTGGVLPDEAVDSVVAEVLADVASQGWRVLETVASPLRGHGGNREVFAFLGIDDPAAVPRS